MYQIAMSGHGQGTEDPSTVYRPDRRDTLRIDLHILMEQPMTVDGPLALEAVKEAGGPSRRRQAATV